MHLSELHFFFRCYFFFSGVLHQSLNESPFSKGWRMKNTKIRNERISDLPDVLLIHVRRISEEKRGRANMCVITTMEKLMDLRTSTFFF